MMNFVHEEFIGTTINEHSPGLENWFPEYCNKLSESTDFDNLSISIKFEDKLLPEITKRIKIRKQTLKKCWLA